MLMAAEREYPLQILPAGPIVGELREEIMKYVQDFEPLEREAARKAKAWLETNVEGGVLPQEVRLVYSEDESQLLGFFVIDEIDVKPSPREVERMQVRKNTTSGAEGLKTIENPRAATQRAMKLVWIARSINSTEDVGSEMFDHAVQLGEEAGCCAIMVEPYDDETAKRLWMEHYEFIEGEGDDDEWSSCLWYPLGEPDQTFA
jgi:hypothetical protein